MTEDKEEYNRMLDRYYKAKIYFEQENVSQEAKLMYLPNFFEVLGSLNRLLVKIGNCTSDEKIKGFKE